MASQQQQTHPQQSKDQEVLDRLKQEEPTDFNLAELARLRIRYLNFPGAPDTKATIAHLMNKWNLSEENLYEKTRQIHEKVKVYQKQRLEEDQQDWS